MIIADSINPNGERLTTIEFELPKFLVAQFNTHSMIRRNSASSRAVPTWKLIQQVMEDPFVPEIFGAYGKGMSPNAELDTSSTVKARLDWLTARDRAVDSAISLAYGEHTTLVHTRLDVAGFDQIYGLPSVEPLGAAKELSNRVLEPWMKTRIVATSSHWGSFIEQRASSRASGAQHELAKIADALEEELTLSDVKQLEWGEWHTPYSEDINESVASCAAVSYLNRDPSPHLTQRLLDAPHPSPFEHVACAEEGKFGAYTGWKSLRHRYEESGRFPAYNEYVY